MNISLDLPSNLEAELSLESSQLNLPLTDYILRVLASRPVPQNLPQTGAELVAYWQNVGVINSRSDIADSQEYAHELRLEAESRQG